MRLLIESNLPQWRTIFFTSGGSALGFNLEDMPGMFNRLTFILTRPSCQRFLLNKEDYKVKVSKNMFEFIFPEIIHYREGKSFEFLLDETLQNHVVSVL